MSVESRLRTLAERWAVAEAAERSNAQLYLTELTDALGVERPRPSGAGYEFEYPVRVVTRDGLESMKRADLFKDGCFILEAKDEEAEGSTDVLLRRAFGQAVEYALFVPGSAPPYLMVLDVGARLIVWDRWHGTYGGFQAGRRVDLLTLADRPDDIAFLQDVWERPQDRDPRSRAEAVTREIAQHLAELATSLEERGHDHERVARFLIRVVFTLFAEDVDLLQDRPFQKLIELALKDPDEFASSAMELWKAMDIGGRFGVRKLLRYNGHFFRDPETVPLRREDLAILMEAARADWADVEPSVFGTLFTRALKPDERHRLGAEFTPASYVERLVRVTIEEPVRERWTLVQGEVIQLRESGKKASAKAAVQRLRAFHNELRTLRVLDPACGSGNFLYVSLAALKRIELEVTREIEAITGLPELGIEQVDPSQFFGLEVDGWAREISELTLWIGYHQWWRQTHGHAQPPEPILRDTGTLECRDAVLSWDEIREDPSRSRSDPTPRIRSPITGEMVPDPDRLLPYLEYGSARAASWPQADFVIGNPPYMGDTRMRAAFGDGYVDALRGAYPQLPAGADYVMYWWFNAAQAVLSGRTKAAGLITTNTIRQSRNRRVITTALDAGAAIRWAIPDHPWIDEAGAADVRVSMTVIGRAEEIHDATLVEIGEDGQVVSKRAVPRLNADLTAHVDITRPASEALLANEGISSMGFALYGSGFILDADEATGLLATDAALREVIRPYRHGRDLTARPRGAYVIDFGLRSEEEARQYPVPFDLVRGRVKPHRDANARRSVREQWWQFGWPRPVLRRALDGLARFIATPETSKHRFFQFLPIEIAPDNKLVCIASSDPFHLGVLSSRIHVCWMLAAGGRLGVGNDPVYVKSRCFDPFPFPEPCEAADAVATLAERIQQHREEAQARHEAVTMTGMYNVVDKLRSGEALTDPERQVHEMAACGMLRDLHDELDAAVAACYGWPWPLSDGEILDRLVALHDERRAEEAVGQVKWLRPEYQVPRFAPAEVVEQTTAIGEDDAAPPPEAASAAWPEGAVDQLGAVKRAVGEAAGTSREIAARFKGARRPLVERHLEILHILGEIRRMDDGRHHATAAEDVGLPG